METLERIGEKPLKSGVKLLELLKRPNFTYEDMKNAIDETPSYSKDIEYQIEVHVKYEGYIKKQMKMIEKHKKLEDKLIGEKLDYDAIHSLTNEAREKLKNIRPLNIGQASRISGVSPADVSLLIMYLDERVRE